jgi:hypothetical protein
MTKTATPLMDKLRELGYVSTDEACKIVGRAPSGSTNALFIKHKVDRVVLGSSTRSPVMWRAADLAAVPPPNPAKQGKSNGQAAYEPTGLLPVLDRMQTLLESISTRLSVVESYIEKQNPVVMPDYSKATNVGH